MRALAGACGRSLCRRLIAAQRCLEHKLLDLAERRPWHFVNDVPAHRHLEPCKLLFAQQAQLSLAARGARLELHATRDLLPINLVWQANYGDRGHRRMAGDYCLDLCGVDVLSATDDHLLKPSLDPAVALLIHAGQAATSPTWSGTAAAASRRAPPTVVSRSGSAVSAGQ